MAKAQDMKLAKRLAVLVLEAGQSGLPELRPALDKILAGRSDAGRKAFLKAFHKAVIRETHKDTLTLESAGPLEEGSVREITRHFSEKHARPLQVVQQTRPELIAGLRARLGDTVYDATVASQLQVLAARIR